MKTLFIVLLALPMSLFAQKPIDKMDKIFGDDQTKPTILLLGVFHFAGEQVDADTKPNDLRINMRSKERQQQIGALVQSLSKFAPTKIAFEGPPQFHQKYDSLYRAYLQRTLSGSESLMSSELVQIGFALAKKMQLTTLYPVDAQAFRFQLSKADSLATFEKYKQQPDTALTYWTKVYDRYTAYNDTLAYRSSTQQYLHYLNSPKVQANSIGRWLVSTKRGSSTEPIGADGFITRYFNRNVRIYSNIQRLVDSKRDRILVIYGATHMYMLKSLFEASPEFTLDDTLKYLKPI
ncbi:MAG: hypothetical protein EOO88_18610 [Pedobacter sp.]|nr:MAG: hypothetical protein EOO88_18610 [Pedobacter sp.]